MPKEQCHQQKEEFLNLNALVITFTLLTNILQVTNDMTNELVTSLCMCHKLLQSKIDLMVGNIIFYLNKRKRKKG